MFSNILAFFRSLFPRKNRRKGGMLQDDLSIALRRIYRPYHEEDEY